MNVNGVLASMRFLTMAGSTPALAEAGDKELVMPARNDWGGHRRVAPPT
jgi:hypothetical protein